MHIRDIALRSAHYRNNQLMAINRNHFLCRPLPGGRHYHTNTIPTIPYLVATNTIPQAKFTVAFTTVGKKIHCSGSRELDFPTPLHVLYQVNSACYIVVVSPLQRRYSSWTAPPPCHLPRRCPLSQSCIRCLHLCICICIFICNYICVCVCVFICNYICICICICLSWPPFSASKNLSCSQDKSINH